MSRARLVLAAILLSGAVVAGGSAAATPAKKMLLRATFSGAYKGRINWVHVQNGITYGCIQWTLPGKPLRYAIIFGEASYDLQPSFFIKFDYAASSLGRPHRLTRQELLGTSAVPPDRSKEYTSFDHPVQATVNLARNLRSGSFTIRNLHAFPEGRGLLHVKGTWKCVSVARRTS